VIILKASKVNLFVSSVLFVFWYHSLNFLDTPLYGFSWLTGWFQRVSYGLLMETFLIGTCCQELV
jgi:hypothetical protein